MRIRFRLHVAQTCALVGRLQELPSLTWNFYAVTRSPGAAYIFYREAGGTGNWGIVTTLSGTPIAPGDTFGQDVSIADGLILVGSRLDNVDSDPTILDSGSAYLFRCDLSGADQCALAEKPTAEPQTPGEAFGSSVALGGNGTGVVGNPGDLSQKETVYVYQFKYPNAPGARMPIPDQFTAVGRSFRFEVADGSFSDPDLRDSDQLIYSATLATGGALPGWLAFDPASKTFSGIPTSADVGTSSIIVTATDRDGLSATSQPFTLTVAPAVLAQSVFDAWRQSNFPPAILNDPAREGTDWGTSADGDADGRDVLTEWLLGLDPNLIDGFDAVRLDTSDLPNSIALIYRRNKSVAMGLERVEWSTDSISWQGAAVLRSVIAD